MQQQQNQQPLQQQQLPVQQQPAQPSTSKQKRHGPAVQPGFDMSDPRQLEEMISANFSAMSFISVAQNFMMDAMCAAYIDKFAWIMLTYLLNGDGIKNFFTSLLFLLHFFPVACTVHI